MKTIQAILLGILFTGVLCFISCKKDSNDPQSCNYAQELQDELNAVNTALNAYSIDPSTANCNAYKTALQNYLTEAEKLVDCATTAGQGAELQASIDASQASVDAIQC